VEEEVRWRNTESPQRPQIKYVGEVRMSGGLRLTASIFILIVESCTPPPSTSLIRKIKENIKKKKR
jgi:hypothetical protein